jgi:hypothetical protein
MKRRKFLSLLGLGTAGWALPKKIAAVRRNKLLVHPEVAEETLTVYKRYKGEPGR